MSDKEAAKLRLFRKAFEMAVTVIAIKSDLTRAELRNYFLAVAKKALAAEAGA